MVSTLKVRALLFATLAACGAALWWAQQSPSMRSQTALYLSNIKRWALDGAPHSVTATPPKGTQSDPSKYTFMGLPSTTHHVDVLASDWFAWGYNENLKSPIWAIYRLNRAEMYPAMQPDELTIDSRTRSLVSEEDFQRGYIPVPLIPPSTVSAQFGRDAYVASSTVSGAVPMKPEVANGPWAESQRLIRNRYAPAFEDLYVITGPIFDSSSPPRLTIGGVAKPRAYYITLIGNTGGGIVSMSFIIPEDADPAAPLSEYLASMQEVEDYSGVTFLSSLDDMTENRIKTSKRSQLW